MDGLSFLGIVLLANGIVLFFVRRNQAGRAHSLKLARSVTVAEIQRIAGDIAGEIGGGNWRDYVKLSGTIHCDRPLISELKQEPCVHYAMTVSREYEQTVTRQDSKGRSYQDTDRSSETVANNRRSIPFFLDDQTGRIEVNPEGAAIETVQVLNDFRQEPGVGGLISYGGFSLTMGPTSGGQRRTLGYRYSESILPIERRVVVVGMLSDHSGSLIVQKPIQSEHRFIISLKDAETLTKQADSTAKTAFYGMIICLGLGALLLLLSLLA